MTKMYSVLFVGFSFAYMMTSSEQTVGTADPRATDGLMLPKKEGDDSAQSQQNIFPLYLTGVRAVRLGHVITQDQTTLHEKTAEEKKRCEGLGFALMCWRGGTA